jgi:uncharacterized protein (TIGR00369 family)
MELTRAGKCFVCGENNPSGVQALFRSNGDLLCSFCRVSLGERFQGWEGIVHGGIIASLLDEACIYAAFGLEGLAVTADLRLRYLKPVPCGYEVTLFGEVVKHRKHIVHTRSRLVFDGEICAEAEAKLFLRL